MGIACPKSFFLGSELALALAEPNTLASWSDLYMFFSLMWLISDCFPGLCGQKSLCQLLFSDHNWSFFKFFIFDQNCVTSLRGALICKHVTWVRADIRIPGAFCLHMQALGLVHQMLFSTGVQNAAKQQEQRKVTVETSHQMVSEGKSMQLQRVVISTLWQETRSYTNTSHVSSLLNQNYIRTGPCGW